MATLLNIIPTLILVVLAAIVAVLFTGIIAMGGSKDSNGRFSPRFRNKMMQARVALQILAVLLFAILLFVPRSP